MERVAINSWTVLTLGTWGSKGGIVKAPPWTLKFEFFALNF